ncbi:MAG: hypothetical protein AAGH76_06835 [Pseudomonadota bacterium]
MRRTFPLPIRLTAIIVAALWTATYVSFYPVLNLLWTCNVGLLLVAVGIASSHAGSLSIGMLVSLVPDLLWIVDVLSRLTTGAHLFGGTEYMFDPAIPWGIRALSLEHALLPLVAVAALCVTGYERRAWWLVWPLIVAVYYLSYAFTDPYWQVNWVWGVFARDQTWMPALVYPFVAASVFWLVLAGSMHLFAVRVFPATRPGLPPRAA